MRGTDNCKHCNIPDDPIFSDPDRFVTKKVTHWIMNTLDMMLKAKDNGKTYRTNDMLYNTKLVFMISLVKNGGGNAFCYLNDLFIINSWQEDPTIYMTKSEAEKKYGIKIVG